MRTITRALLLPVLLSAQLFSQTATALPARNQLISSADLESDLAILRQAYETLHPGLYRYNTKSEMDAHFTELQKEFSRDRTLADAFLALSVFAAQVRCGHTYPNFFNQNQAIVSALFKGQDRVPFYFRWLGDRMIVTADFTPDHILPRGTEILSINGVRSSDILARLMTVARADGSNDSKRRSYLEVTGDSQYEAFDIYFPLFFPQRGPSIHLTIQRPGERKTHDLATTALSFEQRIAPIQAREANRKGGDQPQFEAKFLSDGSAYLAMPNWALYNSKWDWKAWINARLDEFADKNPPALILDLRGNEGGLDVGDEIFPRLIAKDLVLASYKRLVRYRETPAELNPYLDTWDPSFQNWKDAARELDAPWPTAPPVHYFALVRTDDDKSGNEVIHPAGKPIHSPVYVLIDASNSSATFQFAHVMQENRLGTLVGEPTGGSLRGINGGAFFFLRLPKSQIEMDLPLISTFPASPQPDSGLTPDTLVLPSVADIVSGNDPALMKIHQRMAH
jgi:hypothetical protein